jgi:hypothetical protein
MHIIRLNNHITTCVSIAANRTIVSKPEVPRITQPFYILESYFVIAARKGEWSLVFEYYSLDNLPSIRH